MYLDTIIIFTPAWQSIDYQYILLQLTGTYHGFVVCVLIQYTIAIVESELEFLLILSIIYFKSIPMMDIAEKANRIPNNAPSVPPTIVESDVLSAEFIIVVPEDVLLVH